jgi:hypothetical protein
VGNQLQSDDNQLQTNGHAQGGVPSFTCELAAWNVTRLSLPELAALRKQPGERFPPHITPPFLKNSDDQTIASLAAIYSGLQQLGLEREAYRDWGVVSASRYIGRGSFAATLNKYCKDGPWGVSVQVIPHNMLHSISSTISLALPCVGPCLGAGGGADGETDALLIAVNLLSGGQVPGVWVTWSYWDPELVVDVTGKPASESNCVAAVLAIVPKSAESPRASMEIRVRDPQLRPQLDRDSVVSPAAEQAPTMNSLTSILQHVSDLKPQTFDVVCQLRGGFDLNLSWRRSCGAASISPPQNSELTSNVTETVDRV